MGCGQSKAAAAVTKDTPASPVSAANGSRSDSKCSCLFPGFTVNLIRSKRYVGNFFHHSLNAVIFLYFVCLLLFLLLFIHQLHRTQSCRRSNQRRIFDCCCQGTDLRCCRCIVQTKEDRRWSSRGIRYTTRIFVRRIVVRWICWRRRWSGWRTGYACIETQ